MALEFGLITLFGDAFRPMPKKERDEKYMAIKQQVIDKTYTVTAYDESVYYSLIEYDLGAVKDVILKSLSVNNTTNPFSSMFVGFKVGDINAKLKVGMGQGVYGVVFTGDLRVLTNKLVFYVYNPTQNDIIEYQAIWSEIE